MILVAKGVAASRNESVQLIDAVSPLNSPILGDFKDRSGKPGFSDAPPTQHRNDVGRVYEIPHTLQFTRGAR